MIFSFAETEVKILSAKVEHFEGLEKMFLELLKMCEHFETRVTQLENQVSQVNESGDTFLKEILRKK